MHERIDEKQQSLLDFLEKLVSEHANAQQQEEFHAIFEKSLAVLQAKREPMQAPPEPPAPAPQRRWRIFAALAAVLLAALLIWLFWPNPEKVIETSPIFFHFK